MRLQAVALELEHKIWINDRNALRPTTVNVLVNILVLKLGMLLNLLGTLRTIKHFLDEVVLIESDLVLRKSSVRRERPIIYFAGLAALTLAMVVWTVSFAAPSAC